MACAERRPLVRGRPPMKSLFKGAALFVAVACLIWIVVLWRWRVTQREMDVGDIVLYLAVLPVVVFALVLAARWAVGKAVARQDAKAAAMAAAPRAAGAAARPGEAARPAWSWHLLAAWVHTAGGSSVDELLGAIECGKPRPRPDASLHDDEGLPVMTARIADLDSSGVETSLRRVIDAMAGGLDGGSPMPAPARAVRALASLSPLLDELAQSLLTWARQWEDSAASAAGTEGVAPAAETARIVRVLAAWPGDWDDSTCACAQAWLAERLCDPLADVLPLSCWTIRSQRMSGTELLSAAERTLDALQRQGRDDPVVLVACHSDLDAAGIRRLDDDRRLFHSARRPKVAMAGEGAAVLVLSAVDWPADTALDTERVRFHSPAIVRRAESVEAAGRTSSDDVLRLVDHQLAGAALAGSAVAKLASDADQHTARATELFAVTLALLPDLDANEDLRLAGTIAGRLEAAAPLVTLAMAATQARDSGKPVVALSLADPHWRMAAVLRPASFKDVAQPA